MNWLTSIFSDKVQEQVEVATVKDLQATYTQVAKIEQAFGLEIVEVAKHLENQNNEGYGQSTMGLCGRWNILSTDVFKQLRRKGWIDANNELTLKGLIESNDLQNVSTFDMNVRRLVFQDMADGLYWNTAHPLFKSKWQGIVDACEGKEYCLTLKNTPSPFGKTALKLIPKFDGEVIQPRQSDEDGE